MHINLMRGSRLILPLAVPLMLASAITSGQQYPVKPIRVLSVSMDAVMRVVGQKFTGA